MHALTDEPPTGPGADGGEAASDRELAAHLVRLARQIDRLQVAVDHLEADLAARLPAQRADEPRPPEPAHRAGREGPGPS